MTGRAKALYDKGLKTFTKEMGDDPPGRLDTALIAAWATMLDLALPEKKAYTPRGAASKEDLSWGKAVHGYLVKQAPDAAVWLPCSNGQLVLLGAAARECTSETEQARKDVQRVASWLVGGGLSWMREKPTMSYVSRNYVDMVARARQSGTADALTAEQGALDRLREQEGL